MNKCEVASQCGLLGGFVEWLVRWEEKFAATNAEFILTVRRTGGIRCQSRDIQMC